MAAMGRKALVGDEEEDAEEEEVELWDDVPGKDGGWATAGECPEKEERNDEGDGDCCSEGIGPLVVWEGGGGAGGVFD